MKLPGVRILRLFPPFTDSSTIPSVGLEIGLLLASCSSLGVWIELSLIWKRICILIFHFGIAMTAIITPFTMTVIGPSEWIYSRAFHLYGGAFWHSTSIPQSLTRKDTIYEWGYANGSEMPKPPTPMTTPTIPSFFRLWMTTTASLPLLWTMARWLTKQMKVWILSLWLDLILVTRLWLLHNRSSCKQHHWPSTLYPRRMKNWKKHLANNKKRFQFVP